MTTETTPWKAGADVFAVARPTAVLLASMQAAVADLEFESADPKCRFYPLTRLTDAAAGPALIVTDVAEYEGGARQSAVVVSAVVHRHDATDERLVVIRTHVEDQHTRLDGDRIVFEDHHDAIRSALAHAVLELDPEAEHRRRPHRDRASILDTGHEEAPPEEIHTPRVERARVRAQPEVIEPPSPSGRIDLRQLAGIALLVVGFVVLLIAIALGSLPTIIAGIVVAGLLGFAGNRIAGG